MSTGLSAVLFVICCLVAFVAHRDEFGSEESFFGSVIRFIGVLLFVAHCHWVSLHAPGFSD